MRYRRARVAGATYFFTLVTYRRQSLFGEADAVDMFNRASQSVRSRRAFTLEAQVILPDHLHAIWTLPDDDFDYATRWRLIKEAFTRAYAQRHRLPARDAKRRARGEQTSGSVAIGSTSSETNAISSPTWSTSTTTRCDTGLFRRLAIGGIPRSPSGSHEMPTMRVGVRTKCRSCLHGRDMSSGCWVCASLDPTYGRLGKDVGWVER
jgi:REP element-mobilizing transposase RayT